jgi:predicted metal-dependent phosphotriesterase family hydrolase
MNDAHIEAGFKNTLAEQLAESIWREHRRGLTPITFATAHLIAHTVVERMRRAGISEATIHEIIRGT